MKKDQKYSQEEMYLAVELWEGSGLSQAMYSKQAGLSRSVFKYWLKKYRGEKERSKKVASKLPETFIPIKLFSNPEEQLEKIESSNIEILYANGVKVNCPLSMDVVDLQTLINI
jgi:transposase